jgi:hypothetical protein
LEDRVVLDHYLWIAGTGGDFCNAHNWQDTTTRQPATQAPGAGDYATVGTAKITLTNSQSAAVGFLAMPAGTFHVPRDTTFTILDIAGTTSQLGALTVDTLGTFEVTGGTTQIAPFVALNEHTSMAGHVAIAAGSTLSFLSGTATFSGTTEVDGTRNFSGPTGPAPAPSYGLTAAAPVMGTGTILFNMGSYYNGYPPVPTTTITGAYNFAGTTDISAGVVDFVNGGMTNNAHLGAMQYGQGVLKGGGDFGIINSLLWNGGTMQGPGETLLEMNSQTTIAGSATKTLSGRTLDNQGTVTWTGGSLLTDGDIINDFSSGVWDVHADVSFTKDNTTLNYFKNRYLFQKSAGTQVTSVPANIRFLNGWESNASVIGAQVKVLTGTLALADSQSGAPYNVAAGANLVFAGGDSFGHEIHPGTQVTGTGRVVVSGDLKLFVDLNVAGSYQPTVSGTLTLNSTGTTGGLSYTHLNVTGQAALAGTLDLEGGSAAPPPGSSEQVLTYGSETGSFATINAAGLSTTLELEPVYGTHGLTLSVAPQD